MLPFLEKEILAGLGNWMTLKKNPYANSTAPNSHMLTLRISNCPSSAVHIQDKTNNTLQFSFVHPIKYITTECNQAHLRQESQSFNELMQKINLPTYIWENRLEKRFELRWEETITECADVNVLGSLFRCSFILSNALSHQMDMKSAQPRNYLALH